MVYNPPMDPKEILDQAIAALRQTANALEEYRRGLSMAGNAGPVLNIDSGAHYQDQIRQLTAELNKAHQLNSDLANRLTRATELVNR